MKKVGMLKGRMGQDVIIDGEKRVIGTWNGNSVTNLLRTLNRAMRDYDSSFCSDNIPHHGQIPPDLTGLSGDVFVWACDVNGNCLAHLEDGGSWKIVHEDRVRLLIDEQGEWF